MDQLTETLATRAVRRTMSLRLAMWAGGSWLLGLAIWMLCGFLTADGTRAALEAFAAECVIWGLVESGIGLAMLAQARAADRRPSPDSARILRELTDRDQVLRVLRFSATLLLAVFIPLGFVLVIIGLVRHASPAIGHGAGLIVQGLFLVLFDRAFAAALQRVHAA